MPRASIGARPVLAIVAGVAVALAIAAIGGGWIGLARVDPLLAAPGLGWATALAVGLGCRGWRHAFAAALALALATTAITLTLAGQVAWVQTLLLLLFALAAFAVMCAAHALLAPSRWRRGIAFALLALAWQSVVPPLIDRLYAPAAVPATTRWAVVTSLPLRPAGLGRMLADRAGEAAILPVLSPDRPPVMLETVDGAALAPLDSLLLAHPPALSPDALVAIDDWVRRGGTIIILADGLSGWPSPYPLGDRRNPPLTSLLTPLLAHWGLELDAPPGLGSAATVVRDANSRMTLVSAGRLRLTATTYARCRLPLPELARCRVGRGRAVILADADLLDAALWGGVAGPGGPRNWRGGTPYWLADQLSAASPRESWRPRPVWVR